MANDYAAEHYAVEHGCSEAAIAQITQRKATSLTRSLERMVAAGLVVRTPDPLRAKRSLLDIGDPFLRFHYAIIRPNRAALARRQAKAVWAHSGETFRSQVLGPHFEVVCRSAVRDLDLGLPYVAEVGATVLRDEKVAQNYEVDVIGVDERDRVVLIGEAKASHAPRDMDDIRRLDRLAALVPPDRRADKIHRVLFALSGVNAEVRRAADERPDLTVVDAETLCGP